MVKHHELEQKCVWDVDPNSCLWKQLPFGWEWNRENKAVTSVIWQEGVLRLKMWMTGEQPNEGKEK